MKFDHQTTINPIKNARAVFPVFPHLKQVFLKWWSYREGYLECYLSSIILLCNWAEIVWFFYYHTSSEAHDCRSESISLIYPVWSTTNWNCNLYKLLHNSILWKVQSIFKITHITVTTSALRDCIGVISYKDKRETVLLIVVVFQTRINFIIQ